MKIYVFYAGMLYAEYDRREFSRHQVCQRLYEMDGAEIYNGCYIHSQNQTFELDQNNKSAWFRGDFTPVLLEDVPKELLLLKLLLT
jgi:hypothetical protein